MIRNFLRQGFRVFDINDTHIARPRYFFSLVKSANGFKKLEKSIINNFVMGCGDSKLYAVSSNEESANRESIQSDEFVEDVVCQVSDLEENKPKTFSLDEGKVLLIKQKGKISALGTKCTHYGAPLTSSAVGDGRLRCQWHGACFNILNGDIEDFPGVDSLPCYQVTINNNEVKVRAKKSELESNKRVKSMVKRKRTELKHFVVIGGGPAGAICIETLRQEGFEGQLTLVCKENYLPYDRVKVSKVMDFEVKSSQFRNEQFYEQNDIDILKGIAATALDAKTKTISLSNGNNLKYDKVFIATGCKPRRLNIPGGDLKDVIVLRNYDDSHYTNAQLSEDKEVVVIGSSFVAMEAANYCLNKVKKVTVVLRGELPFQPFLGPKIGEVFLNLFKENGIHIITKNELVKVNVDEDEKIVTVDLKDGRILNADIVILGVGSTYYTDFVKNSGIDMRPDGTIETDEFLRTNDPDVFVGGDIAYAPVWSHDNQKSAIGHYPLAHYHGRIAALNMLDKNKKLETVPYFWTMLFKKSIRYAGHGSYDDIIYAGNVEEYKFVAFYLKNDEVVAVSSCGMDPVVSQFAEHLAQGKKLLRDDLKEDLLAWTKNY